VSSGHAHKFVCNDSTGVGHNYACNPHLATEGISIISRLMQLGGPAIANVIQGIYSGLDKSKLTLDTEVSLGALSKGIDWDSLKIGDAVQQFVNGLGSTVDGADLLKDILSQTTRDGKPLSGPQGASFDLAYRCNYVELGKAVWEVIRYNGFLPGVATLTGGGEAKTAE